MSNGLVCKCGHYKNHHGKYGICGFEWRGKQCGCLVFEEDVQKMTLRDVFRRGLENDE